MDAVVCIVIPPLQDQDTHSPATGVVVTDSSQLSPFRELPTVVENYTA